ncbi:hypothetical protein SESBI_06201 [Sesbania bispinosa]|nr:hypothetical protein SESBI_06201 [Sesbania bispinosa]
MSTSSPHQDSSSDPSSESPSGDSSSSSFSSLLGDNPPRNTNQIPVVTIPDSEETESDSDDLSEGGRNVPPPKIYRTFLTETHNHSSEYTSLLAIERFRKSTPVANLTVEPLIILDTCQKDELICLSNPEQGSSVPFTYMYDIVFCKLHLLLPFSNFEKELLRFLNIPPSQLHPNSWAFVRGYQILCHFYSMVLSLDKFFSLFQVKLPTGDEIGWVSFNSIPHKGVLSAYTSSYKKWKQKFFKVRGSGLMSNLLVGGDGNPHFPLFWSLEPRRVPVVKFDQLSFDEKIDVAFLRNQAPIDCGFLLENEDLPARLRQSLEWIQVLPVPRIKLLFLPTKGGKKKLDTPRDNQQQMDIVGDAMETHLDAPPAKMTTSEVLTTDQGIPSSAGKPQGSRPPPHPQTGVNPTSTQNQTSVHTSSGTQGSITSILADKWWCLFNNFKGAEGSDVTSIFDHRFPVEQVVSREFSKKEDIARVNKVGMRNVGKHLMTMGMQTSFFGHCFDSALNSVDKELKDRFLKIQELTTELKTTESATQTIASFEKSLLEVKTKLTATQNEKTAAETRCSELDTKYSDAVAEQIKLKKDFDDVVVEKDKLAQDLSDATEQKKQLAESLDALQKEVAILHTKGFHKAIDQVKLLNPTVNVEGVGVFKKIVDGALVEESEDEEE